MRWLTDRLRRLRWMAVPLAAYVTITLILPAANGAAARPDFAGHAAWVAGGCAVAAAIALAAGEVARLAARARRRLTARSPQRMEESCEP